WFISNVTEAVIAATCVRLLATRRFDFSTARNVVVFIVAAVFASLLSSFLDSAFVKLNHWGQGDYWEVWSTRLYSNVTAALIIVPAIVTSARGGVASLRLTSRERICEAIVLTSVLLAVTVLAFDSQISAAGPAALAYLPLPLLLWAALRF